MSATHRLHPRHTGRTEFDAVAVGQSTYVCSNCIKPLYQKPPFHCSQCDFIVCTTCDAPKPHPVHPDHPLYLVTPTTPWRCDVCKSYNANTKDILCYHCELCDFHLCKKCFPCMYSKLHIHPLLRTDVRSVYHLYNGEWACDICGNNNGPGHCYPAHCQSCQFDLCDNCIKPYRSTYHPHSLYKADSKVTYPEYNGGWRCDRCSREFIPQVNNIPFHCSQCGFDLCKDCMRTTAEVSNADGFDVAKQFNGVPSTYRSGFNLTQNANPITQPQMQVRDQSEDMRYQEEGRTGPPVNAGNCVMCGVRPKNATIVHQHGNATNSSKIGRDNTGHVCCCIECARNLETCPVCRAPIQAVITHFVS